MNSVFIFITMFLISLQGKPNQLEDFRWKNRILLVFQNEIASIDAFSDSLEIEMRERRLLYFFVSEEFKSNVEVDFSKPYLESLKREFGMGGNTGSWVLIGLDGGVKMKREWKLDWNLIFKTIDSMPMRKSEIKRIN
ncbi:DUF4174 domain-containing protein [Shivajiella indica]|uniref:DUF4174 domain-containing protein n=1 Tax=Shivajiella indica TaxID=872115 RepID=A0ABW5B9R0_9BACT